MSRMLLIAILSVVSMAASAFTVQPKVVYGNDDRFDVYQVPDAMWRDLADSTVALISSRRITPNGRGGMAVKGPIFGDEFGLCKDEPFYSQPTGAMCSGFLVGEDLIATAGHCIEPSTCADIHFAFGFKMSGPNMPPTDLPSSEVYRCKEIVARELTRNQDYALVRLDRPVRGHRMLRLAAQPAMVNDPLVVIGHPSGLPTKVAGGAAVRNVHSGFYQANLDTYGGNSGSAVFNARTREVNGILVRGERDFAYDSANSCSRSNYCADNGCRGEDVTHIFYIANALRH